MVLSFYNLRITPHASVHKSPEVSRPSESLDLSDTGSDVLQSVSSYFHAYHQRSLPPMFENTNQYFHSYCRFEYGVNINKPEI